MKRMICTVLSLCLLLGTLGATARLTTGTTAAPATAAPLPSAPAATDGTHIFYATADATVDEASADANEGAAPTLSVGESSKGGDEERILLDFDLSSIPAGATVDSATLQLATVDGSVDAILVGALGADGDWRESSVTWNTQPATTGYGDPLTSTSAGVVEWDVGDVIQAWLDGRAAVEGIVLGMSSRSATGRVAFHSREGAAHVGTDARPTLYLQYHLSFTTDAIADTHVDEDAPNSNYGGASTNYIDRDSQGSERHALLDFDTSQLPAGALVQAATLETYSIINRSPEGAQAPAPAATEAGLFVRPDAVLSSWDEMSVVWNNRPAASWRGDPSVEYQEGWLSYDVRNIVQDWADGAVARQGIRLAPAGSSTGFAFFWDRTSGAPPRLSVQYTLAADAPCVRVEGVQIGGASLGAPGESYTFDAAISPADATGPFSYSWNATDRASASGESVSYGWTTTGQKSVGLTVTNCNGEGVASDNHSVAIETPPAGCEVPLTELDLTGPINGAVGEAYTYGAVAGPQEITPPIDFTWQATSQGSDQRSDIWRDNAITYTWSAPGTMNVSVTAANCGGSLTRNRTVSIVEASALPDLRPGSPWQDAVTGDVGYLLHNEGGTEAPAGHDVVLFQDGAEVGRDTIGAPLPAGGVIAGLFGPAACDANNWLLDILADEGDAVAEGNEYNNQISGYFPCDLVAPTFTSGPTVSNIMETSADVSWSTSELTYGAVEYGLTGYSPTSEGAGWATNHNLTLTNLQPGTTYRVRAFAIDAGENGSNTPWITFQTAPPGSDPPSFTDLQILETPGSPYETFTLQATVVNADNVDRVEFYLNNEHVGTQYGALQLAGQPDTYLQLITPHALGFTRADFYAPSELTPGAVAYGPNGFDVISPVVTVPDPGKPVHLTIWVPGDGHTIAVDGESAPAGTTQLVQTWAAQYDWDCTGDGSDFGGQPGLRCADANPQPASDLTLYFDGSQTNSASPTQMTHDFTLDLSGERVGTGNLRLRAYADDGHYEQVSQELILESGTPQLRFERSVNRVGNRFVVALTVHNDGDGSAEITAIRELVKGFAVVHKSTGQAAPADGEAMGQVEASSFYSVTGEYDAFLSSDDPAVVVDFFGGGDPFLTLPPGDQFTVNYDLIPALFLTPSQGGYYIGVDDALNLSEVAYTYAGTGQLWQPFSVPAPGVADPVLGQVPLAQSVPLALGSADYLLVTSPSSLNRTNGPANGDQTMDLISDMARLARAANGAIGLVGRFTHFSFIDDLLEPGGHWYESLHPNFRQAKGGYVLFVGEDDIIPAQEGGWKVDYSDLRYASTGGAARPELILGRILGNDVAHMRTPLQSAAQFHEGFGFFDNSQALIWSGRGENEGTYWNDVKAMDSRLNDTTAVTRFRGKNFDTNLDLIPVLQQSSQDTDWIIYRGHGSRTGFGDIITNTVWTWDVSGFDLSQRPVALALSCTTGDYAGGADGIAEEFLQQGAAVYIGSVETSSTSRNSDAARAYFNRWHSGRSVGWVLTDLMRDKWGNSHWTWPEKATWERWVYDYHLFGDPKYGSGVATAAPAEADPFYDSVTVGERTPAPGSGNPAPDGSEERTSLAATFVQNVDLSLPDLEISQADSGWHYVSLPDGHRLGHEGEYAVPLHTFTVHYPAGQRVQDVSLASRGGLEAFAGLNIPITVFELDERGAQVPPAAPLAGKALNFHHWQPQLPQPFEWYIFENADGSSDLQIVVYPFLYNPATLDGRFYRDWQFAVTTVNSGVAIASLDAPSIVAAGDTLSLELALANSGSAQEVVVEALVYDLQGQPIHGLPLQLLEQVENRVATVLEWDTADYAPGEYVVEVTVSDTAGNLLDRAGEQVTVSEAFALTLAGDRLGPGRVELAWTFTGLGPYTVRRSIAPYRGYSAITPPTYDTHYSAVEGVADPNANYYYEVHDEGWPATSNRVGVFTFGLSVPDAGQ